MGRYQQQEAIAEVCATEWLYEESTRERAAAVPTYSELLDQLAAMTLDRDTWRDGYMELSKLLNVPEC